jgi:hypothetical protein
MQVLPDGPGEKAGVLPGDVVVEYGGNQIASSSTLARLAAESVPGQLVLMRVLRDNAGRTLEVVVGDIANAPPPPGRTASTSNTRKPPNVVGETLVAAQETLSRAGFTARAVYVEDRQDAGTVVGQLQRRDSEVQRGPDVLLKVAASGVVLVYYFSDHDAWTANALATHLRQQLNDPQYVVRPFRSPRAAEGAGEIRYSAPGFSKLAAAISRAAGPWLARTYGRRVGLRTMVEPRVSSRAIILVMPGSDQAKERVRGHTVS